MGYLLLAIIVSFFLTAVVAIIMRHFDILDTPRISKRKIHKKKIPLGGGWAIYMTTTILLLLAYRSGDLGMLEPRIIVGIVLGGLALMIGGTLDDKKRISAKHQIWFPLLATGIVLSFGLGPHEITNPFGGVLSLDGAVIPVDGIGSIVVFADLLVFAWLMGMMYTTKLLDGLDGLVTGVVGIGALVIFFLSRQPQWFQPGVGAVALILAGACLGFLVWNWHPAKVFLGEGGSLYLGFFLGSLAIVSGGKIATTLLVIGIPMLDVMRVMIRRIQKKTPVFAGDSEHLHFKLMHAGLSHKQAVLLFYVMALGFGASALFLQSRQKLHALISLGVIMILVGVWFSHQEKKSVLKK
jgi:UDP-GlcNAc:undecaprenyl-phosphate/decaprenyl-phosphate GlcNAc-1-phosphate transferase